MDPWMGRGRAVPEGTGSGSSSSSFQYGVIQRMMSGERRTMAHQSRVFTCLYRDGTEGCVRGAEGIAAVRPGRSSESAWSEGSKNYIRNVEPVGSNPVFRSL